ncbi:MAG: TetR/AcrR family transcriptional regulator [Pseudomonas oryzihabitans]|uniref:TetR/AcrR family transcriptional regulator n=1 Tax=Pseudomonas oryzihabitans TaxID=47885 RepID=UPI00290F9C6B|nr:TetR/AcrR family transcriptional regulator [Pseudomonas oryzihabitans]MDU4058673.1 TetR/AcrR family transcriptional regulator [Pseudomonas oryzihabitans]
MSSQITQPKPFAMRIIESAANIIATDGIKAATIRNISIKAGVVAPQIYRHVGNIDTVLDEVAIHNWHSTAPKDDPLTALHGLHEIMGRLMSFGLTDPELFLHTNRPTETSRPNLKSLQMSELRKRVELAAKAGILRVGITQATEYIYPFCIGMAFTFSRKEAPDNFAWLVQETLKPLLKKLSTNSHVLHESSKSNSKTKVANLASELSANLEHVKVLGMHESFLLKKWLQQIASA